jgi:arginyl-tRNA synthetase
MADHALAEAIARTIHAALPEDAALSAADVRGLLAPTPDPSLGDLAFPCFRLAKALRRAPPQIAAELAARLSADALIAEANVAGAYVNVRLAVGGAAALVLPALAGVRPADPPPPQRERIMIEFSQPNTHKAFHVGHLRNLCLGDALVRLLRADGYPVIAANYFGDVGAHIAKCLWWYLDRLTDEERQPPASGRGEWLGELYTRAHVQLELWEERAGAGDQAAAAALAAAKARTTEILRALEARDPILLAIWEQTRQWSLADFSEIYRWCGVTFDHLFYESEVDEEGLRLVDEHLARGVFIESDGAVGVINEEVKHMPFFMLRKKDGTSLYSTKDLALARLKFEQFAIDRSIYVVDVRQSDHFRHVFLTLKKMGFAQAARCQHVPYEMVELSDGAMSGRKGNVILFRALRERMTAHVEAAYLEKFRGAWSDEEITATAHQVALGAIKYGMLARDVQQKIVFELEAWLDLEGNTGPYLQYTHARGASILRRCADEGKTLSPALLAGEAAAITEATAALAAPQERELVIALDQLSAVIHHAAQQLRPSVLCTYLYELAKSFNRFNQACPVKSSEGPLLQGRLLLVQATIRALARGLDVLGIPAPARM